MFTCCIGFVGRWRTAGVRRQIQNGIHDTLQNGSMQRKRLSRYNISLVLAKEFPICFLGRVIALRIMVAINTVVRKKNMGYAKLSVWKCLCYWYW